MFAAEDSATAEGSRASRLDARIAQELIDHIRAQGVSLVEPGGLLSQVTRTVLLTALNAEMTERPGSHDWRSNLSCHLVHCSVYCRGVATVTYGQVLARFGHALSDPTRARLLLALRDGPGYPAELAELLGTTRQNLSNHLTCLRGCGLVVPVPEGRRTRYELADPRLAHALGDLLGLVLAVDPAACPDSEAKGCC